MFSLGFHETLLIVCIALIFIKPQEYPKLFRQIGKFIGKCDRLIKSFSNQFDIYDDK